MGTGFQAVDYRVDVGKEQVALVVGGWWLVVVGCGLWGKSIGLVE